MKKNPNISGNKTNIRVIDPMNPDMALVHEAEGIIRRGGVVVFPTRNLYGLGADALNVKAVERVFQIKKRPDHKPISVLIKSIKDLNRFVSEIPDGAFKIMEAFWPGKITLVFKARREIPDILTAGTGKIGIRLPGHPVAAALVNLLNHPITATSANFSGMEGAHQISDLPEEMVDMVSLILDAGPLKKGTGSTVVDVTTDPPKVIREGEVSFDDVFRNILSAF